MKLKKLAALAMSCAMVITGGAFFAACGDNKDDGKDDGKNPGGTTSNYVEDTRIWYAIGKDTKGTLKDLGWDNNANSKYAFTKDTTVTNENVFTLTLDIYAGNISIGNSFKFLYKETEDETTVPWGRQVGMQHLEGIEGSDASAVLKIDGETVFTTADDNGAFNNIQLAKGQEGTYTFTLKTKSNTDPNPVISVKKEKSITVNYDMGVIGDINDFGSSGRTELDEIVNEGAATTWTKKIEITKDMLYRDAEGALKEVEEGEHEGEAAGEYAAVVIRNERDGKTFLPAAGEGVIIKEVESFGGDTYTCLLLPEGKYNVVFTENIAEDGTIGGSVVITESAFDMYLIGSFNEWKRADADYKMTEQADGTWTATIAVTESKMLKTFNDKGLTDSDKFSAGADVEITAGTWAVKYDPDTNTFQVEKYDYYLVGTFMDGEDKVNFAIKAGVTPKLEATETEGIYTVTYDFKDVSAQFDWIGANVAAVKVVWGTQLNGVGNLDWYGEPERNDNLMISSVGEWTITLDLSTYRITGVKKA
ncbi:MAG: hypothetical protein K2N23_04370 [Clostridia bacterium]|nr:hypothetical protein [Clostridia bacterium]